VDGGLTVAMLVGLQIVGRVGVIVGFHSMLGMFMVVVVSLCAMRVRVDMLMNVVMSMLMGMLMGVNLITVMMLMAMGMGMFMDMNVLVLVFVAVFVWHAIILRGNSGKSLVSWLLRSQDKRTPRCIQSGPRE
jgi:hypothetical protein